MASPFEHAAARPKWSVFRAGCAEIPGYYLAIEIDREQGFRWEVFVGTSARLLAEGRAPTAADAMRRAEDWATADRDRKAAGEVTTYAA